MGSKATADDDTTTVVGSFAPSVLDKTERDPAAMGDPNALGPTTVDTNKIAENLFQYNVKHLVAVTGSLSPDAANLSEKDGARLKNSLERFVLWRNSIDSPNKTLDAILSQSTEVQSSAVSTLLQLGRVIYALVMVAYLDFHGDGLPVQPDELHRFLKEVATIMEPDLSPNEEALDMLYSPEMEVVELLDDLDAYLDCLMDLSLVFQGPSIISDPLQLESIYKRQGRGEISATKKVEADKLTAQTIGPTGALAIRGIR